MAERWVTRLLAMLGGRRAICVRGTVDEGLGWRSLQGLGGGVVVEMILRVVVEWGWVIVPALVMAWVRTFEGLVVDGEAVVVGFHLDA